MRKGRERVVDLRSLTAISPDGGNFLLQLRRNKIKLQCGVYMMALEITCSRHSAEPTGIGRCAK